uniref:Uncharacterized protein n=1 Tax=Chaetoceros debilis TaxID=122233 RepID=A0A7S3VCZ6_9STRA
MFTSLCCPNKVVGLQRSVSGDDKGHVEEVQASTSIDSITDDELRCLLLKAIKLTIRDTSSTLKTNIKIKNGLKSSQNYQNNSKTISSCNLPEVRSTPSELIEKIHGRRKNKILGESYVHILEPIECCDCSGGVNDKFERDGAVVEKEVNDSKNLTSRDEMAVKPDNQKHIDAREGGTENTSFSSLIDKTHDEGRKSFSRQSFGYRQNLAPIEFCGWNRSGSNEEKEEDRICGNYYKTYCDRNATKEMFALSQDVVYRASPNSIEKGFTGYIYSSGDEKKQFLQNDPCRSQTYSQCENYCSNATLIMQISDDLEFSNSKDDDDNDDDDSDISFDSITKFRVLPENSTSRELQQCITLEQNIESERISLPGATGAKCAKTGSEKDLFSHDIVSGDHHVETFDSTSKMSNLSLGEYQEGNELTSRPLTNVQSSVVENIDNGTLEEHFSDKEEITTEARIDGIPQNVIVPSDEFGIIPSDECVIIPSDECGVIPSDECVIVPSDECGIVPSDECVIVPSEVSVIIPPEESVIVPSDENITAPSDVEPKDGIPGSIGVGSGEEVKCGIPEGAIRCLEQEGEKGIPESVIIALTSPYDAKEWCPKNREYGELDEDDDSIIKESAGAECARISPRVCTGLYGPTERQLSLEEELAVIEPSLLRISPHLMSLAKTLDKMDKRACNATLRLHKKSKKIEEERSRKRASALDSSFKQRPTAVQMRQQMHLAAKLKKYESHEDSMKNNKFKLGFKRGKSKRRQDESLRFKQKGSLKRISKAAYCTNSISDPSRQQCLSGSSQREKQKAVNGTRFKKRTDHPENYRARTLPYGLRELNLIHLKGAQGKVVEVKDRLSMPKRKEQYQLQHKRKVHSRLHQKTKMLLEDTRQVGERSVAGEICNRD